MSKAAAIRKPAPAPTIILELTVHEAALVRLVMGSVSDNGPERNHTRAIWESLRAIHEVEAEWTKLNTLKHKVQFDGEPVSAYFSSAVERIKSEHPELFV